MESKEMAVLTQVVVLVGGLVQSVVKIIAESVDLSAEQKKQVIAELNDQLAATVARVLAVKL